MSLRVVHDGALARLTLDRPAKRNAIDDALLGELEAAFTGLPDSVRVVLLDAAGAHFCAGLDLSEHRERTPEAVLLHSQRWQRAFDRIERGGVPVVAVLRGAVIGGGLELAMSTHVRVAEPDAFFALPEGQRGIFVGGGGSVRIARAIGTGRMAEMMLTGRRYDAVEGLRLGLAHYLATPGNAPAQAEALARTIAANARLSNYAIVAALPRIADMAAADGLFAESLTTALTQSGGEARERMAAFLARDRTEKP